MPSKTQKTSKGDPLAARLHPRLRAWFERTFEDFTEAQILCVPAVLARKSILLTSPTGSGKTLAGFLGVFDFLLRQIEHGERLEGVQCIYVSPLRALAYDIEKNLRAPIAGMALEKELQIHLRTGDTTQANRAKFRRNGAPFLVTTPESLAVMLPKRRRRVGRMELQSSSSHSGDRRGGEPFLQ